MGSEFLKTTPKVAQALTSLRGHPDFDAFLEWLREYESSEVDRCRKQTDIPLYRAQGAAEALATILGTYGSAPTDLAKFKPPQTP